MKYAYLILAHHEFELLALLIEALDDSRNDIYIHFDKKVKNHPVLRTSNAGLHILKNRIDVRWGEVSMIEAEYALFQEAFEKAQYDYYHLLSGVDFPIKSNDYIDDFFCNHQGKQFIGYSQEDMIDELTYRVKRIHLFPRYFREREGAMNVLRRIIRRGFLEIQSITRYQRNKNIEFKKGTQWISVTGDFVQYMIDQREEVFKIYQNSFCSDEIFAQTLCWNSHFRDRIYDPTNEANGCMRCIGWTNGELVDFTNDDYERIMNSNALFARKFNGENISIVKKIMQDIG